MEIRHADLQIEVEDAEDGGVLLTIIDSARLSLSLPRKTATELLDAIDACMKTGERQTTDSVDVWTLDTRGVDFRHRRGTLDTI